MSLADAAAIAGLTPVAMRKAVERGRLAAQKVGRDWVVTASSLTAYLNSRRSREPATARSESPARPREEADFTD
jgi:hypothetical protein